MTQESKEIKVLASGELYVAPVSAEPKLPESATEALDAAFIGLGLVTEDGVTFTSGSEVEDIKSWQKPNPVRRVVTGRSYTAATQLQQYNRENFGIAFGGGEWTEPKPGVYKYDPPADADPLAEYVVVVDAQDGEREDRAVIMRATVEGDVETQFVRNAAALLPLTFAALTPDDADRPWFYLSNDEAFAPAGS